MGNLEVTGSNPVPGTYHLDQQMEHQTLNKKDRQTRLRAEYFRNNFFLIKSLWSVDLAAVRIVTNKYLLKHELEIMTSNGPFGRETFGLLRLKGYYTSSTAQALFAPREPVREEEEEGEITEERYNPIVIMALFIAALLFFLMLFILYLIEFA